LDAAIPSSVAAMLVIGLLAADIILPVPSSVVIAFAGKMLGFWGGTVAAWCGMTVGAVVAFGLTRKFGRPMALRFATNSDLERMDALASRLGVLVLTLARPVPILAEASVLLMGTTRLQWWRFLAAVGLSNLGIAAAYAALGDSATLSVVLIASISLPLLAGGIARLIWPDTNLQMSTADQHSDDGSRPPYRRPEVR
jgi:uncharacterized membrane protein YdjX (TVP38/TMEM64 family)